MRAIVVDKDYGSVTTEELERVSAAYQAAGIQVELLEYQVEAARQKEPTEEAVSYTHLPRFGSLQVDPAHRGAGWGRQ